MLRNTSCKPSFLKKVHDPPFPQFKSKRACTILAARAIEERYWEELPNRTIEEPTEMLVLGE